MVNKADDTSVLTYSDLLQLLAQTAGIDGGGHIPETWTQPERAH